MVNDAVTGKLCHWQITKSKYMSVKKITAPKNIAENTVILTEANTFRCGAIQFNYHMYFTIGFEINLKNSQNQISTP